MDRPDGDDDGAVGKLVPTRYGGRGRQFLGMRGAVQPAETREYPFSGRDILPLWTKDLWRW